MNSIAPYQLQLPPELSEEELLDRLEARLGIVHARQRYGIEQDHSQKVFGGGAQNFFHPENWYSMQTFLKHALKLTGFWERGRRNARNIQVKRNTVKHSRIPAGFRRFRILHLTDLHFDIDWEITEALCRVVKDLEYDLCVMTGDYRAQTFGPVEGAVKGLAKLRNVLKGEVYGVLGNHDSIRLLPAMEDLGYRLLLNETQEVDREGDKIQLSGVDDPHYFRVDNLQIAAEAGNAELFTILLAHTPEIFRQAAHAGFDLMLCGHTHGGQICMPGGVPLTLDSDCPRFVGKGAWRWGGMLGYTSVGAGCSIVPVRFHCLPEVTIHTLFDD